MHRDTDGLGASRGLVARAIMRVRIRVVHGEAIGSGRGDSRPLKHTSRVVLYLPEGQVTDFDVSKSSLWHATVGRRRERGAVSESNERWMAG